MSDDRGVLFFDDKEPKIQGYLIIGNDHYQIVGHKVSDIRTNLKIDKIGATSQEQGDMFDGRSSGDGEERSDQV
jgi:hypothetical protein